MGKVWLRLDEGSGILWVGGDREWALETVRVGARLGVVDELEVMSERRGVGSIWAVQVVDIRLAREFVGALCGEDSAILSGEQGAMTGVRR